MKKHTPYKLEIIAKKRGQSVAEMVEQELKAAGGIIGDAADTIGVSRPALSRWLKLNGYTPARRCVKWEREGEQS